MPGSDDHSPHFFSWRNAPMVERMGFRDDNPEIRDKKESIFSSS
jgi:hypothetical protein